MQTCENKASPDPSAEFGFNSDQRLEPKGLSFDPKLRIDFDPKLDATTDPNIDPNTDTNIDLHVIPQRPQHRPRTSHISNLTMPLIPTLMLNEIPRLIPMAILNEIPRATPHVILNLDPILVPELAP